MLNGSRLRRSTLTLAVACLASSLALADELGPHVGVLEHEEWGPVLVDGRGHSLYLYVVDADAEDGIACVGACVNNWPPLLTESIDDVTVEGLDAELLGVRERDDGSLQVTYGDSPLYRSRRDIEPGHTRGQGIGNQFYLVSPGGDAVTMSLEVAAADVSEDVLVALMAEGATQFARNCAVCHGAQGQGGAGPRLNQMQALANNRFIISTFIQGRMHHGMPAFGGVLNDFEIAAVATFVRNSWDNEFGPVVEDEIGPVR